MCVLFAQLLVFPKLESDPCFAEAEARPVLQVLVDGVRVEARATTQHYKPEMGHHRTLSNYV